MGQTFLLFAAKLAELDHEIVSIYLIREKNSRFIQVVTYFKHKEHSNNSFLNIKCVEVGLYTIL